MSSPCLARLGLALLALPLAACGSGDVDPPRDGGDADGGDTDASVRDGGGNLISVGMPQTGSFADLREGDTVCTGWRPHKARCYPAPEA